MVLTKDWTIQFVRFQASEQSSASGLEQCCVVTPASSDVDGLVKKSQPIVTHIGLQFTPKEFNECLTTNYIHHVVRERNCTTLLHADNYKKTCYL